MLSFEMGFVSDRGLPPQAIASRPKVFTRREREILRLIGEGRTTKEIATLLQISPQTVSNHRKHICEKSDIHNTAALAVFAASLAVESEELT
jgi:DNA-binding CsgD family transcriptional regulator